MELINPGTERQAGCVEYESESSEVKQGNANAFAGGNETIIERHAGNLEKGESKQFI